eukprot:UN07013
MKLKQFKRCYGIHWKEIGISVDDKKQLDELLTENCFNEAWQEKGILKGSKILAIDCKIVKSKEDVLNSIKKESNVLLSVATFDVENIENETDFIKQLEMSCTDNVITNYQESSELEKFGFCDGVEIIAVDGTPVEYIDKDCLIKFLDSSEAILAKNLFKKETNEMDWIETTKGRSQLRGVKIQVTPEFVEEFENVELTSNNTLEKISPILKEKFGLNLGLKLIKINNIEISEKHHFKQIVSIMKTENNAVYFEGCLFT